MQNVRQTQSGNITMSEDYVEWIVDAMTCLADEIDIWYLEKQTSRRISVVAIPLIITDTPFDNHFSDILYCMPQVESPRNKYHLLKISRSTSFANRVEVPAFELFQNDIRQQLCSRGDCTVCDVD